MTGVEEARILLDVDGVVADTHTPWLNIVNHRYREELQEHGLYPYTKQDLTRYDFGEKARILDLSVQACVDIAEECWRRVGRGEEPVSFIPFREAGVAAHVTALRNYAPVDVVTANAEWRVMQDWFDHYNIPYDDFIHHREKHELRAHTVIYEDNPYYPQKLLSAVEEGVRTEESLANTLFVMVDQPYNQGVEDAARVVDSPLRVERVDSVGEAVPLAKHYV